MNFGRESESLEFKKSTSEVKEAMDDICAILNKHGFGTLYFGIKPNGDVVGQEIGYSTLDDVARICKEAIKPMIYPIIVEETIDGKNCIKVTFSGNEKPYSSYGRYYKRIVDRSEELTPDELKSMMSSTDFSSRWENNLTKYGIEAVDSNALKSYYQNAISCGRLEMLDIYNEEELLNRLGLMEEGKLNNAGYYLFSNKNPVALKIATYVTDERINFSDIRRVENNIYNLIKYANTYIKEKINWRVEINQDTSREEIPEIPIQAIREIVVNSFAHADYRGVTENEIDITPTQIEIYNPGEFPANLTPDSFVLSNRKSQPRNRVILNTLYKSKDVEIFGSGFKKVYNLCNKHNVKFKYEINDDGFSFIFFRNNFNTIIEDNQNSLTANDYKVKNLLKDNPTITTNEIATTLNIHKRTAQRCIERLSKLGFIIRIGNKNRGYWEVI